jgi:translocator protein
VSRLGVSRFDSRRPLASSTGRKHLGSRLLPSNANGWGKALAAVAACETVGAVGVLVNRRGVDQWLPTLDQPPFQPPDWLFGPVWTFHYALIGLAWHLCRSAGEGSDRSSAERWLAIQLVLNGLWSQLFFGRRRIGLALIDSIALAAAVAIATSRVWRVSRTAGLLLCPYLAWVAFAAVLNADLWRRNRGTPVL